MRGIRLTYNQMGELYGKWLREKIYTDHKNPDEYQKVISLLQSRPFIYVDNRDSNRYFDGLYMRRLFAYENKLPYAFGDKSLPAYCTVLEMMVALSWRCEFDVMHQDELGDRTGEWFWIMMECLGLTDMDDYRYDEIKANRILDIFLMRHYDPDGNGNLFKTEDVSYDMRVNEIWFQMHKYISEHYSFS